MRFEDFKIENINSSGPTEQRAHCPECEIRMPYKHSHSRNSLDLAVNVEKKTWMCWRCGWVGSLKERTIETEYKPVVKKSKVLEKQEKMIEYFRGRGIAPQVINRNKITAEEVYFPHLNANSKAIAFNYFIGDDIVNVKWRNGNKEFLQVKDAPQILYKLNDITDSNKAIVCEGEIDALSFETAGYKFSVSVPSGGIQPNAKSIEKKLEFIENCWEYIKHVDTWYLAFDNDLPGRRMMEEFSRRVERSKCYIIKFPDGCKDANEVLKNFGIEKLRECYDNAEPYPVEGVFEAKASFDQLNDIYENGFPNGFKTQIWAEVDKKIMFYTSTLYGVQGIPNHGKSNFMDHLSVILSITNGIKWGVFSSENATMAVQQRRLIEIVIGKGMLPSSKNKMDRSEFEAAKEFIQEHFFFIVPQEDEFKLDTILEAGKHLVKTKGIKGFIIDPWNSIAHELEKKTETDYIMKILNKLTVYTRRLDLMTFIVFHPAKMGKDGKGFYHKPGLYDGNGSANWGNKLEFLITIYRVFDDTFTHTLETLFLFQKIKQDYMGKLGMVKMGFDENCLRFVDQNTIRYGSQNYLDRIKNVKESNYLQKENYDKGYPEEWDF